MEIFYISYRVYRNYNTENIVVSSDTNLWPIHSSKLLEFATNNSLFGTSIDLKSTHCNFDEINIYQCYHFFQIQIM